MEEAAVKAKAMSIAKDKINRKECTSQDIYQTLIKKKFSIEVAQITISYCEDRGLIDNNRFTRMLVRQSANRGKGSGWIQQKLREKGIEISREEIQKLINELAETPEFNMIQNIIQRKYPLAFTDPKEKNRALMALMRRGYSYETIKLVFRS
jgi:regulatory protein